jgi:hypothetical protein
MRCEEIQERFVDLLYDEAGTPPASPELQAHVASCPDCRRELDGLRGVRDVLGRWTDEPPLRSAAPAPVFELRARRRFALVRGARYAAIAAMAVLAFLALANAQITWNHDGFAFKTRLLSGSSDSADVYTRGEVRDLVRRALDDAEYRLSQENLMMGQRVLDTIDQERQAERFVSSRLRRSGGNN